jgi:hypothetical protein
MGKAMSDRVASRIQPTSSLAAARLCDNSPTAARLMACYPHKFLEARIIPERIEHWIQPEQRRSERNTRRCR